MAADAADPARTRAASQPAILATDPTASFTNSSAAGINRVLALDEGLLLVNNIGRNFELRRLQPGSDAALELVARFGTTVFPGQDFPSIFDLDVHAAFLRDQGGALLACNHYGRLRTFDLTAGATDLEVRAELTFPGDTERILLVGDCLVASSPRGQYTDAAAAPGVLISQPLPAERSWSGALDYTRELAGWGMISVLAADPGGSLLGVGGEGRFGVFRLERRGSRVCLGGALWEAALPYLPQWAHIDGEGRALVAGYDADQADPLGIAWNALERGGLAAFSAAGEPLFQAPLPGNVAWGYGADPIVASADGERLYAVDSAAGLHEVSPRTGSGRRVYAAATGEQALGIGHAGLIGGLVYAGFSRGGYRLFRYDLA